MQRSYLKNRRHTIEGKLQLIRRYVSGTTVRELSAETGIYPTQIKHWISQYQANGAESLCLKNPPYSPFLKAEVVMKILENQLSLRQASLLYRITRSVIQKWITKANQEGLEALYVDNRGRSKKRSMDKKSKKILEPSSREQELLIENERLKAENVYLKKLRALVQERIIRESGSEPKPSKN